jgi:hypothetical protein
MTLNNSLSVLNALKHERPDDDYKNLATIKWPLGPYGEAFPIRGSIYAAPVFKDVHFLVAEGLACPLSSGERMMPGACAVLFAFLA